jgi:hypothetical protein
LVLKCKYPKQHGLIDKKSKLEVLNWSFPRRNLNEACVFIPCQISFLNYDFVKSPIHPLVSLITQQIGDNTNQEKCKRKKNYINKI